MQVMPVTARIYGVSDPTDPLQNLSAGAQYLNSLIDRYDGDLELALAAYNAGPTNVARHDGVPPFPETMRYIDRVLRAYVDYQRSVWKSLRSPQEKAVFEEFTPAPPA